MSGARPQLDSLTGLRGIAAWFVVFYHIRAAIAYAVPAPVTALFAKGYLAVDLFFMLSGFVIWLNYAAAFEARGMAAAGDFLKRRLARIYPLHLFVLLATAAFAAAMAVSGRPEPDRYPWAELPLHLALLQNWGFTHQLSWNHPAWSISTEFAAYLAFPLLVIGARIGRWPPLALVAGAVALCVGLHLAMAAGGEPTLGGDIPRWGLLRCLVQFACGALLCRLWLEWRDRRLPSMAAFVLGLVVCGSWAAGFFAETLAYPLIVACLLFALSMADGARWNPLSWRPLVWLGEISYSTYLIHFGGWTAFKLLLVEDAARVPLWQAGLFLALVLLGSALCYRFVEQPGRRWISSWRPGDARGKTTRAA